MNTAVDIATILKQTQEKHALTDEQFAETLGISRQSWSLIKTGRQQPTRQILSAIIKEYPELTVDVMLYLKTAPDEE
jgi:DNA-binding XRE family transcriptional regulator